MSLITTKKFIGEDQVDETKILLSNDAALKARNAADDGNVNILKLNDSDEIEFSSLPVFGASSLATEGYVGTQLASYVETAELGVSVATLESGKIPASQLPSYVDDVLEYADLSSFPATGETGKIYIAIDTGNTYRWTGSVYADVSAGPSTTDDLAEGSTNLYHTVARARTAAVVDSTAGNETDQAASVASMKAYVAANAGSEVNHEEFTLSAGNITDGYVTLAAAPLTDSVIVSVAGAPGLARNGTDFTIGGPSLDRVVFAGDLVTLAEAGDILTIYYQV